MHTSYIYVYTYIIYIYIYIYYIYHTVYKCVREHRDLGTGGRIDFRNGVASRQLRSELASRLRLLDGLVLTSERDLLDSDGGRSAAKTFNTVVRCMLLPKHIGLRSLRDIAFNKQIGASTIRRLRTRACQIIRPQTGATPILTRRPASSRLI
jgi:hypothetical protein